MKSIMFSYLLCQCPPSVMASFGFWIFHVTGYGYFLGHFAIFGVDILSPLIDFVSLVSG